MTVTGFKAVRKARKCQSGTLGRSQHRLLFASRPWGLGSAEPEEPGQGAPLCALLQPPPPLLPTPLQRRRAAPTPTQHGAAGGLHRWQGLDPPTLGVEGTRTQALAGHLPSAKPRGSA